MLTAAVFHVPVIPLEEVPGRDGTLLPAQIERVVPKLKTGLITGETFTCKVKGLAHCPAAGVKV